MKKYALMTLLLCCGVVAWADNNITLSDVQGAAGTEVTVSVSMTNSDVVSALQLSIPLGDDLTFVANSQKTGSRASGHTVSAGVKDGVLNVMVYSNTMAAISSTEGEICSFKLLLGNNPGTISLEPSKTALTGIDGSSVATTVSAGTVDIRGAKLRLGSTQYFNRVAIGQSNIRSVWLNNDGNELLSINEIVYTSSYLTTTTELPLTIAPGNTECIEINCTPTARGNFDEVMTITSNSVSGNSTIRLTATPYAINELNLVNASGATGEEVPIGISMKNYDEITGLQMEIKMPDGLEFVDGSFELSSRKQDHAASAFLTGNMLSIVAFSPSDKAFIGSDGEIGRFKVKIVGSSDNYLRIDEAMMTATIDGKAVDVLSDKNDCKVSIKSPRMYVYSSTDFGNVSINQSNVQRSLTIWNDGAAPLTISDVVFVNGLFSIKEQLPLTISASSRKDITIMCNAKEAGDISTTMEIYSNDPNKRLYTVNVTGHVFTPDYLAGNVLATSDEVKLIVSLNNYSDIYGIQFDIESTEQFTATANDVELTNRSQGVSVNINAISDHKLRVMAYSQGNKYWESGNGSVFTIALKPQTVLANGDYSLKLTNIVLGSKDMQNKYAGDSEITVDYIVGNAIKGDVNGDGIVDIADAMCIVNHVVGKEPPVFIEAAADVNDDGTVDIADAVKIVNLVMGKSNN